MTGHLAARENDPVARAKAYLFRKRGWRWYEIVSALVFLCGLLAIGGCLVWLLSPAGKTFVSGLPLVRDTSGGEAGLPTTSPSADHDPQVPGFVSAVASLAGGQGPAPNEFDGDSGFKWGDWGQKQAGSANPFESELSAGARNTIDSLVLAELDLLNIKPAKLCSDEVFLRRVYIDTLGTLPTVDEAVRFLDDPDPSPEKRSKLIEQVLDRAEFADYWAMKWCDILRVKAEFPINLWPNAAQAYHHWIREAIKNNLPYDVFAYELLTASGSNFRTPQVNFYRAVQSKEPANLAQAVALTFMCERTENWPTQRLEGMSVFFSRVGFKPTGEWKEEIVYFDPRQGKATTDGKPLKALFPDGTEVEIAAGQDPRQVFADWLVRGENPWFARAAANRVWCWLLGRGIVDPPDDMRLDNPASHPDLLNHLAQELVSANYDLKQLMRLILNSSTYQLACIPPSGTSQADEYFSYYSTRRLDAEVLIDAICQITGTTESYSSIIPEPFTFLPDHQRAIALPDGSIGSSFLEMFGRPPRDTGLESERNNRLSAAQALHLLNSNHLRNKLRQGPGINNLIGRSKGPAETAELLYLAILSRRPTQGELYMVEGHCGSAAGAQDVAWALINSDEFLFRH